MPTIFGSKKQVRFAYKNRFHSPPPTPALTFASSFASSPGPITPPSISHGLPGPSPYTIAHVPSFPVKSSHYVAPHAAYLPNPTQPNPHPLLDTSAINWNLMDHFSTITRNNHFLPSRALCESATTPPLPFLSITSKHLPWVIKAYASNGSFVTLADVFDSIYHSLRTNITPADFKSLPRQKDQQRATYAYEDRYRRIRSSSARASEKQSGMKRIDFFRTSTSPSHVRCQPRVGPHAPLPGFSLRLCPQHALSINGYLGDLSPTSFRSRVFGS